MLMNNLGKDAEIYPNTLPDIFYDSPLMITGTYKGERKEIWQISGEAPSNPDDYDQL